jgi:hypothetical protein
MMAVAAMASKSVTAFTTWNWSTAQAMQPSRAKWAHPRPESACANRNSGRAGFDEGGIGLVDALRNDQQHGVEKQRHAAPHQNLAAHTGGGSGNGDQQNQPGKEKGAAHHGAGVQFQHLAVEIGIAGLLRQTVAGLAHSARHIAVAMRLAAVHNILVRCG